MQNSIWRDCLAGLICLLTGLGFAVAGEVAGVKVNLTDDTGPATLAVEATDKYQLRINIDPQTEKQAITLQVELPISGPNTWPINDVVVFDSNRQALPVRRSGIEWHILRIAVPPDQRTLLIQAVKPEIEPPPVRPEKERSVTDPHTGISASIAGWHDGKRAALSIRFDDSHPTHLSKAIPILNQYGFRGTFMVNPGGHPPNSRKRSAFEDHRDQWEAVARRGRHEFANHTLNHSGADNDESMEREVGEAAQAIWKLFPEKSKLTALNLGGGTQWVTTRPLRYYLDKYHSFDASANSTGMDDSYGNRVATFRRLLEAHIERGLWYKVHYHYIGEGLSSSEANFRAALDIAKKHQDQLWIAGMAEIYKYQTERRAAGLEIEHNGPSGVTVKLSCDTPFPLYDQPLTLEVTVPEVWARQRVVIGDAKNEELKARTVATPDGTRLRFEVRPTDAEFVINTEPSQ